MWLDSLVNVRLSAQQALLGRIAPEVRLVTVEHGDGRATMRVYHDGPLSPETEEEFDDASAEMMADVPGDERPDVRVTFVRSDSPAQTDPSGWPVYRRKEPAVAG